MQLTPSLQMICQWGLLPDVLQMNSSCVEGMFIYFTRRVFIFWAWGMCSVDGMLF